METLYARAVRSDLMSFLHDVQTNVRKCICSYEYNMYLITEISSFIVNITCIHNIKTYWRFMILMLIFRQLLQKQKKPPHVQHLNNSTTRHWPRTPCGNPLENSNGQSIAPAPAAWRKNELLCSQAPYTLQRRNWRYRYSAYIYWYTLSDVGIVPTRWVNPCYLGPYR